VTIDSPQEAKEKHGIVMVHQNLSLAPDLTVWENINLGHETSTKACLADNTHARRQARKYLDELGLTQLSLELTAGDLQPGEKQMVEIAKALSQNPKMLILDEPTAALEYQYVEKLFAKVGELKEKGVSVLFISHRLWEITRLCDIVYAFSNGETVGKVDFNEQPRDENLIVPLVAGPECVNVECVPKPEKDFSQSDVALKLEKVCHHAKLTDISFEAYQGEVLGIGGLSGQGQDDLIMLLAGAINATAGSMVLNDLGIRLKHPKDAVNRGIYLVPGDRQTDGLFMGHSIFRNIIYPSFAQKNEPLFLNRQKMIQETDYVIDKTAIKTASRDLEVSHLSGGNQQKVVFGKWLRLAPKVLLLNDPAKGVDIQAMEYMYSLVHELAAEGTTLIRNCDRVLVMFEGRIVEEINHANLDDETLIKSALRVGSENKK
jgi:ribose transport system ATP-binding protein